jgi:hypothetical protein
MVIVSVQWKRNQNRSWTISMMEIVGIDEGFTHVDDDRIFHEKKIDRRKKMK